MADANETKVFNDTENDYYLKEGNAGQYRQLMILKKRSSTIIKCDLNATYREYWVGTAAGEPRAVIPSDDCAECSEIRIVPSGDGRLPDVLVKKLRNPAAAIQVESTSDDPALVTKNRGCVIL